MGRLLRTCAAALGAMLCCAAPAAAQQLITIDAPSQFADGQLKANVLLPDGYEKGGREYPVLYLLHGAGGHFDSWASPKGGDIADVAKGLGAIVVMPEGGKNGFYTDWWSGAGGTSNPRWERYFRDDLVPLVKQRFRVRPERRWHTIAGASMGGYGAVYLAGQVPGYFGTAIPMSGVVSIQRANSPSAFRTTVGLDYGSVWGPLYGFYAEGHNPLNLVGNLAETHVDLYTGDGSGASGASASIERELHSQNDEYAAALRAAGAPVTETVTGGGHDWPTWKGHLRTAIQRGLFPPVRDDRRYWSFKTVSGQGVLWGLRFYFTAPPAGVVTFTRQGGQLSVTGLAQELILADAGGCSITTPVPMDVTLPSQPCRLLRVRVAPKSVRVRQRRVVAVSVRTTSGAPVSGARVRIGRRSATTRKGRARVAVRATKTGRLTVRVTLPGYRTATVKLRVKRRR